MPDHSAAVPIMPLALHQAGSAAPLPAPAPVFAAAHAAMVAGHTQGPGSNAGWTWILSDLKTALESGSRMAH